MSTATIAAPAAPLMREVPEPTRGSGPVTCCGGHRQRCIFGNGMHSWSTWYENGSLQRTSLTFRCDLCDGICTDEEADLTPAEILQDRVANFIIVNRIEACHDPKRVAVLVVAAVDRDSLVKLLGDDPAELRQACERTCLNADLAEWITGRGAVNRAGYSPEKTAGLIIASLWGPTLRQMIDADDSRYLRNCAENIRNANDQDDDEWAAEDYRDGHGPVDGLVSA